MTLTRARVVTLGAMLTILIAVIIVYLRSERSADLVLRIEPLDDGATLTVYVGGAVRQPALYTLAKGARVAEAVSLAGPLSEADIAALPMADRLKDGQELVVPKRAPTSAPQVATASTNSSTPGAGTPSTGRININSASAAELESLPGIGPALAQRIIDYRTEHGPFATVEALEDVRGISARMVEELQDRLSTGE